MRPEGQQRGETDVDDSSEKGFVLRGGAAMRRLKRSSLPPLWGRHLKPPPYSHPVRHLRPSTTMSFSPRVCTSTRAASRRHRNMHLACASARHASILNIGSTVRAVFTVACPA
jgi:hypothetical protein